ncbi:MAG: polysaccharide deacetylase family protein [Clostridia bacterium]|nr:polysaccharide deacetylase family protein [Clostridia bacterium]
MFATVKLRKAVYFITVLCVLVICSLVIYTADRDSCELPVFMYHSILKDSSRTGKYVVTPQSFEEDLEYLTDHGYKSVSANDVISYINGENELPEKPYLLTFDDGSYNNLTYVLPLLEKYDAYAIISVVGSYSEKFSDLDEANPAYSYLRWCDVTELENSGRVQIANHSYDFHKIGAERIGAKIGKYESENEYERIFTDDLMKTHNMLKENCEIDTKIYTYPYGAYCKKSEEILTENGYIMTFICAEGINKIGRNPDDIRLLKRFNRHGLINTADFFARCGIK